MCSPGRPMSDAPFCHQSWLLKGTEKLQMFQLVNYEHKSHATPTKGRTTWRVRVVSALLVSKTRIWQQGFHIVFV